MPGAKEANSSQNSRPSTLGSRKSADTLGSRAPVELIEKNIIIEMDNELSISLVIILVIGGVTVTALLACYACIFRDLCCRRDDRSKRRRNGRDSPVRGSGDIGRGRLDAIQLNDITQADSMPTESEKV